MNRLLLITFYCVLQKKCSSNNKVTFTVIIIFYSSFCLSVDTFPFCSYRNHWAHSVEVMSSLKVCFNDSHQHLCPPPYGMCWAYFCVQILLVLEYSCLRSVSCLDRLIEFIMPDKRGLITLRDIRSLQNCACANFIRRCLQKRSLKTTVDCDNSLSTGSMTLPIYVITHS